MSKKQTGLNPTTIADDLLVNKIYQFRMQKVMLESDLAELCGVETKRLNERGSHNRNRFPSDFMFQLTEDEWESLRSEENKYIGNTNRNSSNVSFYSFLFKSWLKYTSWK